VGRVEKLPSPPRTDTLRELGADVVAVAPHTVLWRVQPTNGPHVVAWDELRHFGPVPGGRFDPHRSPPREQREGVQYLAVDLPTALAEHFQATRVVDRRRRAPAVVAWRPTRTLELCDLTGSWPVRVGASHVINTGSRERCQEWARAIRTAFPDLDGLWSTSSMTGEPCVTLFRPARSAFPEAPDLSQLLAHPGITPWLAASCREIGFHLL
jgi:hypothetical protein